MTESTAKSGREASRRLAGVALVNLAVFVTSVIALHVLRRDYSVVSRHLSEYAVGPFGWMMEIAFATSGFALTALALGLRKAIAPNRSLVLGCRLILLAALLNGLMASFRTDLSVATAGLGIVRTTTGRLHDALAALHALVWIAAPLFVTAAIRQDPRWSSFGRASWFATVIEIALVLALIVVQRFVPGLGQRIWVASLVAWCAVHAGMLRQVDASCEKNGSA